MSRDIPSYIEHALTANEISPYYAVEILFDSGPVRVWSGLGDRTIDGNTYTGAGTLLQVSGLEEVSDLSARSATVTLSGMSAEVLSLALTENYQRRTANIYVGMDNGQNVSGNLTQEDTDLLLQEDSSNILWEMGSFIQDGHVQTFSGSVNTMTIEDGGDTGTVSVLIDSKLVELSRASNRRYTSESHKARYPGDVFFDFVADLQDKEIVWGRK